MVDLRELSNIERFTGLDYNIYKFHLSAVLRGKELYGIADSSEAPPSAIYSRKSSLVSLLSTEKDKDQSTRESDTPPIILNEDEINEYKARDSQAFAIICQTVDRKILHQSVICKTAKDLWDKLALLHERTAQHQEQYNNIRLTDSNDMARDIELLNSQVRELGGTGFIDSMIISKLIGNLPATYDHLQTMWKSVTKDEQTLQNLQAWLLDEERYIRRRYTESLTNGSRSSEPTAYFSKGSPASFRSAGSFSGFNGSSGGSGSTPAQSPPTPEQQHQRRKEINEGKKVTRCRNCGQIGHWYLESPLPPQDPRLSGDISPGGKLIKPGPHTFMASVVDADEDPFTWFMDSSASHHMTDQRH